MAKGSPKNKSQQAVKKPEAASSPALPLSEIKTPFSWTSLDGLSIIIMIVTLLLFGNTVFNQYALDDGLVFTKNSLVTQGFRGIGPILSHDTFFGAFGDTYSVNGGRYRPLSLVTFAIEDQIIGLIPWFSHLLNVLLYGLTGILLMRFLNKYIFKKGIYLAFFAAILFIIHPLHTEVVANIKSRDEILSLIFLILTLNSAFKFVLKREKRSNLSLLYASAFYILALLSKENGLTFLFILPVTLWFFTKAKVKDIINASLPFIAIAIAYILFRVLYLGFSNAQVTELLDNPYLLATTGERYATIFYVLFYYIRLLIFPHPLTYDYSYNQVPYRHFTDLLVILSILIHIGMSWFVLTKWKSKDPLVWCILFYMASMFIVSNIVMNVGTFLAERFLFQSSIAFCMALVILADKLFTTIAKDNSKLKSQLAIASMIVILIPASAKTITRNHDWRNDSALFLNDEQISYGSARAATYAAVRYSTDADTMKDSLMQRQYRIMGLKACERSYGIYPNSPSNFFNWGVIYSRLDSLDKAEWAWNEARKIKPNSSMLEQYDKYLAEVYFKLGLQRGLRKDTTNDLHKAIIYLNKAVRYGSDNPDYWYNLGGAYFTNAQYDSAKFCWQKTLELKPDHAEALKGLSALH